MQDICEQCGKSLVKEVLVGRDGKEHRYIEAVHYAPTGVSIYAIGIGYTTPFHLFCSTECRDSFISFCSSTR